MNIIDETYVKLNKELNVTGYDYSTNWLKRSKSYYAYLKSSGAKASNDVLLGILGEALRRKIGEEETNKTEQNSFVKQVRINRIFFIDIS